MPTPSLADLLNAPSEMEHDGKAYQLRQPTLLECGRFQRWLEAEARAAAAASVELPEADRRQLLRDVTADIAAQRYAYGGDECARTLQTPNGLAKLLSIVCEDQGLGYEQARRLVERRTLDIAHALLTLADGAEGDPEKKAELARLLRSIGLPPNSLSGGSSSSPTPTAPPPSAPSPT